MVTDNPAKRDSKLDSPKGEERRFATRVFDPRHDKSVVSMENQS